MAKNPPAVLDSWVASLDGEGPLRRDDNLSQYARLESSVSRGLQRAAAHGAAKRQTQLNDFNFVPEGKDTTKMFFREKRAGGQGGSGKHVTQQPFLVIENARHAVKRF